MVNVEIDGKKVEAEKGATVIEAAQQAGVYIPHFCYHKKLSLAASCRMCLVEVEKMPRPVPACVTTVAEGMKVMTRSEMAIKAQKGVMEFLLINHPLDCPICDQGGECQLQDIAMGYGGSESRYTEEKRIVIHKEAGELISMKEMSRCIHCTRCVRFGQEVGGIMELGMMNRNEHAQITSFVNSSVDSELSGNMIDLCPVGALTSKPFRYTARNWELSRRRSVSPHDSLGANIAIHVKNSKVMRITPVENEEINECWISDKDRFGYEGLNSADRLTKPMIKQGGEWKEVDWAEALEYVANGLRQIVDNAGAEQIAALASGTSTLEELYLLQKLVRGLGSDNIDFRLRQTNFSLDATQQGAPWLGMPIADLDKCDRFLVVGSFLRKDQPLMASRVRAAAKSGAQVNWLHAASDDELMNFANKAIVAPNQFVQVLAQVVKSLLAKTQASLSDDEQALANVVTDAKSDSIADSLLSGSKVAVLLGNYAQQHPEYAQLYQLANLVAKLSKGSFGVFGESANSVGGYLANAVPFAAGKHGMNAFEMMASPRKAYILMNLEAELDMANPQQALAALQQADLVVAMSPYKHKAMEYADVLLPISPFTETSGTFVSAEGRAQSFRGAVAPLGETRPAWKVLRVLANLLRVSGMTFDSSEQVRDELIQGRKIESSLSNENTAKLLPVSVVDSSGLQRVTDVPVYFTDSIVRRAASLQKTNSAKVPTLQMNQAEFDKRGIKTGDLVNVSQSGASIVMTAELAKSMPAGTARISAAHALTSALGAMFGMVEVTLNSSTAVESA